jgi:hypothetical protein
MSTPTPVEGLVVHPVGDELLVYDPRRGRLYWLNSAAAGVWRMCNGQASISDANVVALGVRRLGRARLLTPANRQAGSVSHLVRRMPRTTEPRVIGAQLGSTLHAEAAGPCRSPGERCGAAQPPCCPGLACHAAKDGRKVCGEVRRAHKHQSTN